MAINVSGAPGAQRASMPYLHAAFCELHSHPMSPVAVLDEMALDRLRGFGGDKLLRGMIELFLKNAPARAADAREALDCGDAAALRAALHALKSSAGQLGAVTVHQSCVAGEELASRGDLSACALHIERIEADLPMACRALDDLLPAA